MAQEYWQSAGYHRPPVTETVHYGYWGRPFVFQEMVEGEEPQEPDRDPLENFTRLVTLPRRGESQTELERDLVRASWPSR